MPGALLVSPSVVLCDEQASDTMRGSRDMCEPNDSDSCKRGRPVGQIAKIEVAHAACAAPAVEEAVGLDGIDGPHVFCIC